MAEYREKIIKAEQEASKIVDELVKLKAETLSYNSAKTSLEVVTQNVKNLIDKQTMLAEAQRCQIDAIKEIDTAKLVGFQMNFEKDLSGMNKQVQDLTLSYERFQSRIKMVSIVQTIFTGIILILLVVAIILVSGRI